MRTNERVLPNERQCLSKRPYLTQADARRVAERAMKKRGVPLRAYECPNCRWWHLTKRLRPANDNGGMK